MISHILESQVIPPLLAKPLLVRYRSHSHQTYTRQDQPKYQPSLKGLTANPCALNKKAQEPNSGSTHDQGEDRQQKQDVSYFASPARPQEKNDYACG
ncbi:MAG: hypothetical protein CEE40_12545 [Chloroflexi bacterium B3_Chlor]|nr:MAG: hypothetical protein CEE40_12545 [Chloroflexi bacterium B3_Chlor]